MRSVHRQLHLIVHTSTHANTPRRTAGTRLILDTHAHIRTYQHSLHRAASEFVLITTRMVERSSYQGCHVGGIRHTFTDVAVAINSATFIPVIRASELMAVPARLAVGFVFYIHPTIRPQSHRRPRKLRHSLGRGQWSAVCAARCRRLAVEHQQPA